MLNSDGPRAADRAGRADDGRAAARAARDGGAGRRDGAGVRFFCFLLFLTGGREFPPDRDGRALCDWHRIPWAGASDREAEERHGGVVSEEGGWLKRFPAAGGCEFRHVPVFLLLHFPVHVSLRAGDSARRSHLHFLSNFLSSPHSALSSSSSSSSVAHSTQKAARVIVIEAQKAPSSYT